MSHIYSNKKWLIKDKVLLFEDDGKFIVPSSDEIYSALFESSFTDNVQQGDLDTLNNLLTFSKYPVTLNIDLETIYEFDLSIHLTVKAFTLDGLFETVQWPNDVDHIIINNTWYPYSLGIKEEISQYLKAAGINKQGKIRLGDYLLLIKNNSDILINNVISTKNSFTYESTQNPDNLQANLYQYQKDGWKWLQFMWNEKIGGILADEMGLGKTIQIIALLCSESPDLVFQSLIISPATLLENWRRELAKFAPHISTHIHHGAQRTGYPKELKKYSIIITSYDTIIRDNSLLNQIEWKLVICDEAQAIKNPKTKRALSLKNIQRQIGFAVSGTPIENNLTDLWSLMDFAVPGFLGNISNFELTYKQTLEGASRLEKIISPLILRRTVVEVAKDLPSKIIIPQVLELKIDEAIQYEQIREVTLKDLGPKSTLILLTRLRLFCAHPFLINDLPNEDPSDYSNKYSRLVELTEEIVANNSKMLVFTSYNKMNDMITLDLGKRFNIYSKSIDGRTPVAMRQNIIDQFSKVKGSAILVLNPIAAGTGLNITAANHVIHYNLEWNPAKEDQASARSYRRGQDKPVTIHRLFYANTVEEAINERLDRKRLLAGTAIVGVKGDKNDFDDLLNAIHKSPKRNN